MIKKYTKNKNIYIDMGVLVDMVDIAKITGT